MNDIISSIALLISSLALLISVKNWARLNRMNRYQMRITFVIDNILEQLKNLNGNRNTVRSKSDNK